ETFAPMGSRMQLACDEGRETLYGAWGAVLRDHARGAIQSTLDTRLCLPSNQNLKSRFCGSLKQVSLWRRLAFSLTSDHPCRRSLRFAISAHIYYTGV